MISNVTMVKVVVESKGPGSFTGGLYPLSSVESSIQKIQAMGFKVISAKMVA